MVERCRREAAVGRRTQQEANGCWSRGRRGRFGLQGAIGRGSLLVVQLQQQLLDPIQSLRALYRF